MPNVVDINAVVGFLGNFFSGLRPVTQKALDKCGRLAQNEAISNAPVSPTQGQKNGMRTTKRKVYRKATAHTRSMPGGLEKSISMRVSATNACVFVAASAPARRYARIIHDGKGTQWHKRGRGTILKGSRADSKFIERAIKDNQHHFLAIIQEEVEKEIRRKQ